MSTRRLKIKYDDMTREQKNEYHREYYKNNKDKYLASFLKYKAGGKYKETKKKWKEKNRKKFNNYQNNYHKKRRLSDEDYRLKGIARASVQLAIKRKELVKPIFCEMYTLTDECCNGRLEAHHEDYSKPLDVMWLCKKHHINLHNSYKDK